MTRSVRNPTDSRFRAGILAAGLGERFRAAGVETPKALLEVGGQTLLARAIHNACDAGASEVVLIVNDEVAALAETVRRGTWPIPVELIVKTTPSSMESLFALEGPLRGAPFLLLTVDAIAPRSVLTALVDAGLRNGPVATYTVTQFIEDEKPLRVVFDEDRRFTAIGPGAESSPWITSGLYFLYDNVFDLVSEARRRQLGALREFSDLVLRESGLPMFAHEAGKTIDVDRPEDLAAAESFVRERK